jgi:glycosyltransferase involved in cell wall biosynthesis
MNANPFGHTGLASIIVPCWNQLAFTRQCVAALRQHTRPPWELLVIDNGSTDGTRDYLAGVQDASPVPVTVIANSTNLGFPAAINLGLQHARGEYLVLLNNDVVVTEGWLDQLIALSAANLETTKSSESEDLGVDLTAKIAKSAKDTEGEQGREGETKPPGTPPSQGGECSAPSGDRSEWCEPGGTAPSQGGDCSGAPDAAARDHTNPTRERGSAWPEPSLARFDVAQFLTDFTPQPGTPWENCYG